jgi:hypothetical protein
VFELSLLGTLPMGAEPSRRWPPPRARALEDSARLFTLAVERKSSPLLIAAASEALGTATLLRRAGELALRFETHAPSE